MSFQVEDKRSPLFRGIPDSRIFSPMARASAQSPYRDSSATLSEEERMSPMMRGLPDHRRSSHFTRLSYMSRESSYAAGNYAVADVESGPLGP